LGRSSPVAREDRLVCLAHQTMFTGEEVLQVLSDDRVGLGGPSSLGEEGEKTAGILLVAAHGGLGAVGGAQVAGQSGRSSERSPTSTVAGCGGTAVSIAVITDPTSGVFGPYPVVYAGSAPGRTRTCGLAIRSRLLYPAELRGRVSAVSSVARTGRLPAASGRLAQRSLTCD
jgi:hypothetical protein